MIRQSFWATAWSRDRSIGCRRTTVTGCSVTSTSPTRTWPPRRAVRQCRPGCRPGCWPGCWPGCRPRSWCCRASKGRAIGRPSTAWGPRCPARSTTPRPTPSPRWSATPPMATGPPWPSSVPPASRSLPSWPQWATCPLRTSCASDRRGRSIVIHPHEDELALARRAQSGPIGHDRAQLERGRVDSGLIGPGRALGATRRQRQLIDGESSSSWDYPPCQAWDHPGRPAIPGAGRVPSEHRRRPLLHRRPRVATMALVAFGTRVRTVRMAWMKWSVPQS